MPVKHRKTSTVPNALNDTRRIGGDDWNNEHDVDLGVSDITGLEERLIPTDQVVQYRDDALAYRNQASGFADDAQASATEAAATLAGTVKTADLSAASTVPAYGFSASVVQSILDNGVPLSSYAEMSAYAGRANGIRITTPGIAGPWRYNAALPNTSNGGTQIAHASGTGAWERLFDGTGVFLSWFGADITGATDIGATLDKMLPYLLAIGGGTILGMPGQTFRLNANYNIRQSDVHIDLQFASLVGNGRLYFNGDSGIAGDWSKACNNVSFRNARIGGPAASQGFTPFFLYCTNSAMENIYREGYGDTAINMFMCKNTHFRNITTVGGKDVGAGAIAALMLLCFDSSFENIYAYKGPFTFGIQVKGGRNCKVIDCVILDVLAGAVIPMKYGFYNRGDDPWNASPTGAIGYSYPWPVTAPSNGWDTADIRRASTDIQWVRCRLVNSYVQFWGFISQEFVKGGFYECGMLNDTTPGCPGFQVFRSLGGLEADFDVIDNWHEATGGVYNGYAFQTLSNDATNLPGIKFRGNRSRYAGFESFNHSKTTFDEFAYNVSIDPAQAGNASHLRAYNFDLNTIVKLAFNKAIDNRGTPIQTAGFTADSTCLVTLLGNEVTGFATRPYALSAPANWGGGNSTAFQRTTTSGTGDTGAFLFAPVAGARSYVEFTVIGKDSTGVVGVWKIAGVFANDGGTVTQVGATISLITAVNPGAWTGASFQIVSNSVRLVLTGKAATTIVWTGSVETKNM